MVMISNRPNPNEAFPNPNIPQGEAEWPSRTCPKIGSARGANKGRRNSTGRRAHVVLCAYLRFFLKYAHCIDFFSYICTSDIEIFKLI